MKKQHDGPTPEWKKQQEAYERAHLKRIVKRAVAAGKPVNLSALSKVRQRSPRPEETEVLSGEPPEDGPAALAASG